MGSEHRVSQRRRVAQEAATMLYTGQEKEYKQAKLRAAKNLGIRAVPSNAEVAVELDSIAEEREGHEKQLRLIEKRRAAFRLMQTLEAFHPLLVGSVWRGTAHRSSDIDVITYTGNPQKLLVILKGSGYTIDLAEERQVTKEGRKEHSLHVHSTLPSGEEAEIIVRSPEEIGRRVKCEIYGDQVTGLTLKQLEKVLEEDPRRKFVSTCGGRRRTGN